VFRENKRNVPQHPSPPQVHKTNQWVRELWDLHFLRTPLKAEVQTSRSYMLRWSHALESRICEIEFHSMGHHSMGSCTVTAQRIVVVPPLDTTILQLHTRATRCYLGKHVPSRRLRFTIACRVSRAVAPCARCAHRYARGKDNLGVWVIFVFEPQAEVHIRLKVVCRHCCILCAAASEHRRLARFSPTKKLLVDINEINRHLLPKPAY
jgi:hypothetical protein